MKSKSVNQPNYPNIKQIDMRKVLIVISSILFLTACEVEFSPNAEWKNVPVVYCLLDQDDDTTWVRVQRCYLTEGNIYNYGLNSDSVNYPQGAITVSLLAWENGVLKDSMAFEYTTRDRDTGHFASANQPLYFCRTKNRLKENYSYVLSVRNAADNSLLAVSDPVSLIKQTSSSLIAEPSITVVNGTDTIGYLGFYTSMGSGNSTLYCYIRWYAMENARLYQPILRFYYESQGTTKYVDLHAPSSKGTDSYYSRDLFLDQLKHYFGDDTTRKRYIPRMDLYLTSCSEELNAYLSTGPSGSGASEMAEGFSNINGGVGIFASRRTHLYKRMPADSSITPGRGLIDCLMQLNLGFY